MLPTPTGVDAELGMVGGIAGLGEEVQSSTLLLAVFSGVVALGGPAGSRAPPADVSLSSVAIFACVRVHGSASRENTSGGH